MSEVIGVTNRLMRFDVALIIHDSPCSMLKEVHEGHGPHVHGSSWLHDF